MPSAANRRAAIEALLASKGPGDALQPWRIRRRATTHPLQDPIVVERATPSPMRDAFNAPAALIKARRPDSTLLTRQVGGQEGQGSKAGWYADQDSQRWYVKEHKTPEHAFSEHLANQVLRSTGVPAPKTEIFSPSRGGSQVYFGSKEVPHFRTLASYLDEPKWREKAQKQYYHRDMAGFLPHHKAVAQRFLQGAASDALIDANDVHTGNIGLQHHSLPVRIDNGAAFLHDGFGNRRKGSEVEPVHSFGDLADPYLHAMKMSGHDGMSVSGLSRYLKPGVTRINKLRERVGSWQRFVDRTVPMASKEFRQEHAEFLENRHHALADHVLYQRDMEGLPAIHVPKMVAEARRPASTRREAIYVPENAKTKGGLVLAGDR